MKFGLMFFAASEDALVGDKYRLVTESARFGDRNGFSSVWVPERHFTKFGSLYPNPVVLQAALAMKTERIALRAGSVVAPLHHPLRIAEEWSVVDNLSGGRVGISFAPGWNPDDFAIFPERYASRYEQLYSTIATVRRLWRGESLEVTNGTGQRTTVRPYPTPVQRELPIWVTAASSPQSYTRAGELGANLLTHLLDQGEEELGRKICMYRDARAGAGFDPAAGVVTVMLHTFVGEDANEVREQARAPFCNYIRHNIGLLNGLARSRGQEIDVRSMSPRDLGEFVEFLYERFAGSRGLIGTPETCLDLVARLEQAGVDEIACLLDFGPDADLILSNLPHLARLKDRYEASRTKTPTHVRFEQAAVQARCMEEVAGSAFHTRLRGYGIEIGPR
ncbi:MAG: LLM class flavin-dependent oxidoreductase, partial [Bryobacteraceae bacterium]